MDIFRQESNNRNLRPPACALPVETALTLGSRAQPCGVYAERREPGQEHQESPCLAAPIPYVRRAHQILLTLPGALGPDAVFRMPCL